MSHHARFLPVLLLALALGPVPASAANPLETMGQELLKSKTAAAPAATSAGAGLAESDIVSGLKEALQTAVSKSIKNLGQPGGFLDNAEVRIPVPEKLSTAAKGLRLAGQGELVDEFEASMNTAAEKAVPETADILGNSISQMSFEDANKILNGPSDAATQYFEKTSRADLKTRILPVVKEATDQAEVTASYKRMIEAAPGGAMLASGTSLDLDGYVADKALDGLFSVMASEEAAIRQNPAARTTDLLKKVFGQ